MPTSADHSDITRMLTPYRGKCMYRPKQEYEILSLLERSGIKLVEAVTRLEANLEMRRKTWKSRDMRSRARNTHMRLVAAVPEIRSTLLRLAFFLFKQLSDKDELGELSSPEFSTRVKSLKKVLKAVENISENVEAKANKWEDALKHCGSLEGLI